MSEVKKIIHKVKSLYYMEGGVEREWERDLAALIAHIEKLEAEKAGLQATVDKPWQRKAAEWLREVADEGAMNWRHTDVVESLARSLEREAQEAE